MSTSRSQRGSRRDRRVGGALCAALAALVVAGAARAADDPAAADSGSDDPWVLQEFDWGDSRDLVDESVRYSLPFTCNPIAGHCVLPVVKVEGEDLLVRFGYFDGLYRIRLLTPDLTRQLADVHAERVWKLLVDYIARHKGKPDHAEASFPGLDGLPSRGIHVTHRWKLEDQVIQVGIGRHGDKFYVAATFFDPVRSMRRLESAHDKGKTPDDDDAGSETPSGS